MARVSAESLRRFEEGDAFKRLRTTLEDPRVILNAVGLAMKSASQEAFVDQKFGKHRWDERMNPNIPALIRDFQDGKKPPERRFKGRDAGVDTGRGKGSIGILAEGRNFVEVGTTLDYMDQFHTGGETQSDPVTETVWRNAVKWLSPLKRTHPDRYEELKWLGDRDNIGYVHNFTQSARPFVGIPATLAADIQSMLGVEVRGR